MHVHTHIQFPIDTREPIDTYTSARSNSYKHMQKSRTYMHKTRRTIHEELQMSLSYSLSLSLTLYLLLFFVVAREYCPMAIMFRVWWNFDRGPLCGSCVACNGMQCNKDADKSISQPIERFSVVIKAMKNCIASTFAHFYVEKISKNKMNISCVMTITNAI